MQVWPYNEIPESFSPNVNSGKIAVGSYVGCIKNQFWGVVLENSDDGIIVKSHQTGRRRKIAEAQKIPHTNAFLRLKSTGEWLYRMHDIIYRMRDNHVTHAKHNVYRIRDIVVPHAILTMYHMRDNHVTHAKHNVYRIRDIVVPHAILTMFRMRNMLCYACDTYFIYHVIRAGTKLRCWGQDWPQ